LSNPKLSCRLDLLDGGGSVAPGGDEADSHVRCSIIDGDEESSVARCRRHDWFAEVVVEKVVRHHRPVLGLRRDRCTTLVGDDACVTCMLLLDHQHPGHHVVMTQMAQHIIVDVAVARMLVLCFISILPHSKTGITCDIGLKDIELILIMVDLEEEAAATVITLTCAISSDSSSSSL
jgi:hypothetical protein